MFFLKNVVYFIIISSIFASNLKNFKNTSTFKKQSIFSKFLEINYPNKTSNNLGGNLEKNKINSEKEISFTEILFIEIWDKTFISTILIYFEVKTSYIISITFLTKIFLVYLKWLIEIYGLNLIYHLEIFKAGCFIMFYLIGFSILFKLMFVNLKQKNLENFRISKKIKDEESIVKISYFDFNSFIRTFGIVFLSQITGNSSDHNSPLLNEFLFINTNKFLMIKLLTIVLSILFAFLISFIFKRKFCIEFNLIISAITFLLMGIDESVKFFAVCE